jgi:4-hydroxybenzoate polyprenyltransferase
MANSKSDKSLVRNMVLACLGAILIFHFAWLKQLITNYHNLLFAIGDIALLVLFAWQSKISYEQADNPNKEWRRWVVVLIAAALCLWAGGWAAYLNEKIG